MSRLTIVEGNSNDKDNVRVVMVKGEKGEKGETGDPTKLSQLENDTGFITAEEANLQNYYNKSEIDATVSELNNVIDEKVDSDVVANNYATKTEVQAVASGSPKAVSSISEMTDTTKNYILTTDGKWYYYNGSNWVAGGTYQSSGISYESITTTMFQDDSVTKQKTTNNIIKNGFFDDWRFGNRDVEYTQDRIDAYLEALSNGLKTKADNGHVLLWAVSKDIIKVNKYPHIEFDYTVDTTSNSGCMVGFSSSNAVADIGQSNTTKLMWGYHPTRGFCMYDGTIPNFVIYEEKENITSGTYHFTVNTDIEDNITFRVKRENYDKTFNISFYGNPNLLDYKYAYIQLVCKDADKYLTDVTWVDNEYFDSNKILNNKILSYNSYGKQSGRNVFVYQFGGEGNDWCFVRTPSTYDPTRKKPYPFVICNHGNGWVMDGSLSKANWTKRTMYVEATDSDYIDNPTQYNLVPENHPEYLYSNPTIEALLSAGYIVCGCENYGDLLYGNDNCRNACVDFFYHMINNYNVEDRCYMIGASNGAQTSINASYILNGKIKAMILQYPLTCLVNQYFSNQNQQIGIRNAYNISNEIVTEEELISLTRTHDVLHTDVIDNVKLGYFPPTKLYYSSTDTVVNYQINSLALKTLLDNSLKVVEGVQVDSDGVTRLHGDYAHFNPAEYVEWFNKY